MLKGPQRAEPEIWEVEICKREGARVESVTEFLETDHRRIDALLDNALAAWQEGFSELAIPLLEAFAYRPRRHIRMENEASSGMPPRCHRHTDMRQGFRIQAARQGVDHHFFDAYVLAQPGRITAKIRHRWPFPSGNGFQKWFQNSPVVKFLTMLSDEFQNGAGELFLSAIQDGQQPWKKVYLLVREMQRCRVPEVTQCPLGGGARALVGAVPDQVIRQPLQGVAMVADEPMTGLEHRQRPPEGRRRNTAARRKASH